MEAIIREINSKSAIRLRKSTKRTPLKEIAALKYHTSAMEIADMLLEVNL